jgi:hypothetical protein
MSRSVFPFRFVDARGVRYLRLDDVALFIRQLNSVEAPDVRCRLDEAVDSLNEAADHLLKIPGAK